MLFPAAKRGQTDQPRASVESGLFGSGIILVVDDEPTVRNTARFTLERYGYRVLQAEDGQQAIDISASMAGQIQAALLDLTMPVMGGEEALRHLKEIDPQVRVILSSGFNEVEATQRFTGKGITGFIQKPYTAVALARKVKAAIS